MQPQIPEEIEAMAAFLSESANIDSSYIERPVGLNTNTNTIKHSINQYVQEQRRGIQPPPIRPEEYTRYNVPLQIQQPLPQVPQYAPIPQKVDDGQLELNLEPSKVDIIINLLKEISGKLAKQNNLIEKQYDSTKSNGENRNGSPKH